MAPTMMTMDDGDGINIFKIMRTGSRVLIPGEILLFSKYKILTSCEDPMTYCNGCAPEWIQIWCYPGAVTCLPQQLTVHRC